MSDLNFIIVAWLYSACCKCEVKVAQNNGDFTAIESWVVMKYLFLKGNLANKIYDDLSVTLDDKHPSYPTVKN
jgi:hypothetical protein